MTPADDDERLHAEDRRQAGGEQLLERVLGAQRGAQAGADQQQVGDEHGGGAEQAHLLADGGEDEVVLRLGHLARAAEAEPGAGHAAVGEPVQRLHDLVAGVERVGPRVEPDVDARLDVVEQAPRHVGGGAEHQQADQEVARPLGGDPHDDDEEGEEQQRRAEVALADHDHDGDAPGDEDRQQVAGFGEAQRADLPGAGGEQLAVVGEVGGEEDRQGELGELAGLEVDRPEVDPDAGAADAEAEPRHERHHEQGDAAEQQHPPVAGEVRRPLDDDQREHEHDDGDDAPRRLQPGEAIVEAGDHHVADAVEQGGEGEHRRVGAAGEPAHGEVGDDEHAEQHGEERDDAGGDDGELAERGERVGAGRDQRGHHDERQLRRATGAHDAGGHRTSPTARRSSWSTGPWSSWWWSWWSSSCSWSSSPAAGRRRSSRRCVAS